MAEEKEEIQAEDVKEKKNKKIEKLNAEIKKLEIFIFDIFMFWKLVEHAI